MDRKTKTIALLFCLACVLALAYVIIHPQKGDGFAKVSMLNIGQGDSFLIQSANGKQLLIDGGRDEKVLTELAKVLPRGDRSIDVVIATHPDADHIGGLSLVLERYKVGLFLTSEVKTDTKVFRELYVLLDKKNIPSYYVRKGMSLGLDKSHPADFTIVFPDRPTENWQTNPASVVGRLQVGERSVLFTGDSTASVEEYLATVYPALIDVDILKLGHHGSKTSSSEVYLRTTSPALALISAGIGNSYGHPSSEVIDRLDRLRIPYISTQTVGTYTLTTDGQKWYKNNPVNK